jgi:hypothetical protein
MRCAQDGMSGNIYTGMQELQDAYVVQARQGACPGSSARRVQAGSGEQPLCAPGLRDVA